MVNAKRTAKTRAQALICKLLAASDFVPDEIKSNSLPVIREWVYRLSSLILLVAAGASALFLLHHHHIWMATLNALLCLLMSIHAWLLLKKNIRILSPILVVLISLTALIATVAGGFHQATLWGFAFPVAFYLLVEKREALYLNIAWWVIFSTLTLSILPTTQAVSYMLCLATIGFHAEVLCSILHHNEETLKQLAVRDPLTNAYNRRVMIETMEQAIMLYARHKTPTSVVIIDIDKFKFINDSFGHKEGDTVLVNLVSTLSHHIRSTDKLCRFGGEEFVAVLTGADRDQACHVANAFCELVRNTWVTDKIRITISCGVSEVRTGDNVTEWLHRGDMALYHAKNEGRDRVVLETHGKTGPE